MVYIKFGMHNERTRKKNGSFDDQTIVSYFAGAS